MCHNPDIVGVVEAEDRVVLKHFTDAQLRTGNTILYPHVMLIDGTTTVESTSPS